jgi:hypothetical protein
MEYENGDTAMKARYINPYTDFDARQLAEYEESLKVYRDLKGVVDTSFEEGKKEKALEMARMMKKEGEPVKKIVRYTGLTPEEIEKL